MAKDEAGMTFDLNKREGRIKFDKDFQYLTDQQLDRLSDLLAEKILSKLSRSNLDSIKIEEELEIESTVTSKIRKKKK